MSHYLDRLAIETAFCWFRMWPT